jgi:hypothetical protein
MTIGSGAAKCCWHDGLLTLVFMTLLAPLGCGRPLPFGSALLEYTDDHFRPHFNADGVRARI